MSILSFMYAHAFLIVSVMLGVSEALAQIPQVQANSIVEAIINGLKGLQKLLTPAQDAPKA